MHDGSGTPRTADGVTLAAEWVVPDRPAAAAVLAHPHPLMGGTMHVGVTGSLFEDLPRRGVAVLRFDFRGAGASQGTHGGGRPEAADVRAASARLGELAPGVDRWLVGWSFGADVSLQVVDDDVRGWVLIAPPLATVAPEDRAAAQDPRPKLLLVPEHDQYRDPSSAAAEVEGWAATTIEVVPGADHFLAGRLGTVADLVAAALGARA
jgi:alpha/beta superfamily hydrolase